MNVFDYLDKNCKEPFSAKSPLNEIDALILSRFSYLPFDKIKLEKVETILSIAQKMKPVDLPYFIWPEDKKLILKMAKAKRFRDLPAFEYVKRANKKTVEQFSAISVYIPGGTVVISYTGTDSTLNGWREDCNMAIFETIPSQKSAKKYLKEIAKIYPLFDLILVGHSKGGTLSMFAATTAKKSIKSQIKKVYSFDGPGLSEKYSSRIPDFTINYIPQDSLVGRMMFHTEKTEVVKSDAKLLYQHNVYSWEVSLKTNQLIRSTISKKSDVADRALKRWVRQLSRPEKEQFFDLVFKIIEDSKVGTPNDMAKAGASVIPKIIEAYRNLEKSDRRVFLKNIKSFLFPKQ